MPTWYTLRWTETDLQHRINKQAGSAQHGATDSHLLFGEAEHGAELVEAEAAVEGAVRKQVRAQRLALQLFAQHRQHLKNGSLSASGKTLFFKVFTGELSAWQIVIALFKCFNFLISFVNRISKLKIYYSSTCHKHRDERHIDI